MAVRDTPILDRNNPDVGTLPGHTKVTRNDWLNIARDVLVNDGVGEVKILKIAAMMGVSRSSFYWYFANREDLLDALLAEWSNRNTAQIIAHCQSPAPNISFAISNFFQCFINPAFFDSNLDFAVREWARRDSLLRTRIDTADAARLHAVCAMFQRYGYGAADADGRARILYFMQLGYHALKVSEPMSLRISRLGPYLRGFIGHEPDSKAITALRNYIAENHLT